MIMLLGKKCPSCAKKLDKKFNYCPYCGKSIKVLNDRANYGMLGKEDSREAVQEELKLPFGMNKIMNSLVKQLENQLGNMNVGEKNGAPRGFKIRVVNGVPQMKQVVKNEGVSSGDRPKKVEVVVSMEEEARRMNLPKVDAESNVKRLSDRIIYEIDAPGIKKKENVVITELASGVEIKIYSSDFCYVKSIPLKVEIIEYYVEKDKVFVEIKG